MGREVSTATTSTQIRDAPQGDIVREIESAESLVGMMGCDGRSENGTPFVCQFRPGSPTAKQLQHSARGTKPTARAETGP